MQQGVHACSRAIRVRAVVSRHLRGQTDRGVDYEAVRVLDLLVLIDL